MRICIISPKYFFVDKYLSNNACTILGRAVFLKKDINNNQAGIFQPPTFFSFQTKTEAYWVLIPISFQLMKKCLDPLGT